MGVAYFFRNLFYTKAAQNSSPVLVTLFINQEVVYTYLVDRILFDTRFTTLQLIGMAVVMCSLLLLIR
jgi:drug/metabolite transporter (DMT)-like permease